MKPIKPGELVTCGHCGSTSMAAGLLHEGGASGPWCSVCGINNRLSRAADEAKPPLAHQQTATEHRSLSFAVVSFNTPHLVSITRNRLAELERAERALKDISSGSPAVFNSGTPHEFKCSLCHAHIDEARRALGYQLWPAVPHTPIAPPSAPTNDAHLHH